MEILEPIIDSFEIDATLLPATNNEDEKFAAFRQLLIRRIEELAEKDMQKLLWILYRVDVREKKLHETLKQTPPEKFAEVMADMIIAQQCEKAESRKKFGGSENDWNFDI